MFRFVLLLILYLMPSFAFATKRLAVLEFRGVGVDEAFLRVMADDVRIGVLEGINKQQVDGHDILVMTRENMMDMLSSMGKTAADCQGECEVEIARNIGADYVISGDMTKIGSLFVLNIKLHETTRGELLAGEQVRKKNIEDMLEASKNAGINVTRKGLDIRGSNTSSSYNFTGGQFNKSTNDDWSVGDDGEEVIVEFKSIPSGATVYVDGQFLCSSTPCQKYLSSGTHDVRFSLQRYGDVQKSFSAKKGVVVAEELQPLFGTVRVSSIPSGISIYSGGQKWGSTPFEKEVDPGIYTLDVKERCYEPVGYRFQMKQGGQETVKISLTEKKSGIKVYPYEGDNAVEGRVFVDGKEVGVTAKSIGVPLCSKLIEVRMSNGKVWRNKDLDLKEKEVLTIEARVAGKAKKQSPTSQSKASSSSSRTSSSRTTPTDIIEVMGYEMARIPAGTFTMGCTPEQEDDCLSREKPSHEVILTRDFYMGTTEVTQGLYRKVMGKNPSYNKKCGDNCPVEKVSWYDAVAFTNKLSKMEGLKKCYSGNGISTKFNQSCTGYALPTEAEWEYAARGGEIFKYSGSNNVDEVAWYSGNSGLKTHPVGEKKANGYGLYDMSGNVYEWVWDWYGSYSSVSQMDPTGVMGSSTRVLRGGYCDYGDRYVRVSLRNYIRAPPLQDYDIGFRLRKLAP